MIKIKSILIFVLIISSLSSCKIFEGSESSKKREEEVKVDCFAADFRTTTDYFRATSSAYDIDEMLAQDKALLNSKMVVVSVIRSVVQATATKYIDQASFGKKTNFKEMFLPKINQKIKEVLNQELTDYNVLCQNTTKLENGTYQVDLSIEVSKRTVVDGISTKMYSSSFSQHFDAIKFEQLFNDELKILIDREKAMDDNTVN